MIVDPPILISLLGRGNGAHRKIALICVEDKITESKRKPGKSFVKEKRLENKVKSFSAVVYFGLLCATIAKTKRKIGEILTFL